MSTDVNHPRQTSLTALAEGAVGDLEKLISQHFDLLRSELKQEVSEAKEAALSIGAGAGVAAAGGLLGTLMVVHLLHEQTRLPLWTCYGLVGGLLGAAGAALLSSGVSKAAEVQLVPRQTAQVLRKELAGAAG